MSRALPAALVAALVGLGGCGGSSDSDAVRGTSTGSDSLTVYSSLPLTGSAGEDTGSMVRGEKLALLEFGGKVGRFSVKYVSADDAAQDGDGSDPTRVVRNAQDAVRDKTAIAFLGGYSAAASAIALPIINQAAMLQVSPTSSYPGLTKAEGAGKGEPDKFYPSGKRTFARVIAADDVHASAIVGLQRDRDCESLFVLKDRSLDGAGVAEAVTLAAQDQGLRLAGTADAEPDREADRDAEIAADVAESGATCLFYGGTVDRAAVALLRAVGDRSSALRIYATGTPAASTVERLGPVARRVVLTSPVLDAKDMPEAGQEFLRSYRARYGTDAAPSAIYGYEAMKLVLQAIQDAGDRGNDRQAVIDATREVRDRESVLGTYSITRSGDTTLSKFAVRRLAGTRLVSDAVIEPVDR